MAERDWFRNTEWNENIEANFWKKFHRARDKAQPLRIQASILASTDPQVALRLLTYYFELGERFDLAQAYVDKASAYTALGDFRQAVSAYEAALAREAAYPQVQTEAFLALPFVIATQRLSDRYNQALQILVDNFSRPFFPVDYFLWHSATALIFLELGYTSDANNHAIRALNAASVEHSGLRYHAKVGLVGMEYDTVCEQLRAIISSQASTHDWRE